MSNTFVDQDIIAKMALADIKNNCVMGKLVDRQFEPAYKKVGDTIRIRKPIQFTSSNTADISDDIQNIKETTDSLTLAYRRVVPFSYTTHDATLTIEEFTRRYITPAAIRLANDIDNALTGLYANVYNSVGAGVGTDPSTFAHVADAGRRLTEEGTPLTDRRLVCCPKAYNAIAGISSGLYVQNIAGSAWKTGGLSYPVAGFDVYQDQNIRNHTSGDAATATKIKTTVTKDSTLTQVLVDGGGGAEFLKKGDVFGITDRFAVNPISKEAYGWDRQFVVTEDVTGMDDGIVKISPTISMSDDIIDPARQNIASYPVDEDDITLHVAAEASADTNPVNLAFHKDALVLAFVKLDEPVGSASAKSYSEDNFAIRVVQQYDVLKDETVCRLDILFGVLAVRPEWACRLPSDA